MATRSIAAVASIAFIASGARGVDHIANDPGVVNTTSVEFTTPSGDIEVIDYDGSELELHIDGAGDLEVDGRAQEDVARNQQVASAVAGAQGRVLAGHDLDRIGRVAEVDDSGRDGCGTGRWHALCDRHR